MTLTAYATARPLHDLGATPRAMEAPTVSVEGLRAVTLANATRYAKQAALSAHAALMAGDAPAARTYLAKAQRWEAYALALRPSQAA